MDHAPHSQAPLPSRLVESGNEARVNKKLGFGVWERRIESGNEARVNKKLGFGVWERRMESGNEARIDKELWSEV